MTGTVVVVATAGVDAGSNTGVVVVVETTVAGFDTVTVAPEPVCTVTGAVVFVATSRSRSCASVSRLLARAPLRLPRNRSNVNDDDTRRAHISLL